MNNEITIIVGAGYYESVWGRTSCKGVNVLRAYNTNDKKYLELIRRIQVKYAKNNKRWFNKELLLIEGLCVFFDAMITEEFLQWFSDNNKKVRRKIFYYWNAIESNMLQPEQVKKMGYEVWSFDPDDCKQYNLKYNPEFYCQSWYEGIKEEIKYDVSFIGRDKGGRMQQIEELAGQPFFCDLKWDLYFTPRKWWWGIMNRKYKKYLPIEQMLKRQLESKAILDYSQDAQSSITLRIYDALVNDRKVITNNQYISKMDLYKQENVFVLGQDDPLKLKLFLETPFIAISEDILQKYEMKNWKNRFYDAR